jgi:hypothetical protein
MIGNILIVDDEPTALWGVAIFRETRQDIRVLLRPGVGAESLRMDSRREVANRHAAPRVSTGLPRFRPLRS